jgi:hypothetical protein
VKKVILFFLLSLIGVSSAFFQAPKLARADGIPAGVAQYDSLAFVNGRPYVAYQDNASSPIDYATVMAYK